MIAAKARLFAAVDLAPDVLFYVVVAGAPLPFGSTDPLVVDIWVGLLGLTLVALALRRRLQVPAGPLALFVVFGGLLALVMHEQLAASPWIRGESLKVWDTTARLLQVDLPPAGSIVRNLPIFEIKASLAALLSLLCGFVIASDPSRAGRLPRVIGYSSALYAFGAIGLFLFEPGRVFWHEKDLYRGVLTAPFLGRSSAAAYYGTAAVIWFLLAATDVKRGLPRHRARLSDVRRAAAQLSPKALLTVGMFFVTLSAVFMTSSRAGSVLSLAAIIVAFVAFFHRQLDSWRVAAGFAVILGGTAFLALEVFGAGVSSRFDTHGLSDAGRVQTFLSTWEIIRDNPIFGTGLGTFFWSYPAYRSPQISDWGTWHQSHNVILEIASEMGLVFAAAVVVAWLLMLVLLAWSAGWRRRDRLAPCAGLAVAFLGLSYSMVDLPLQIPGYAIVFFALIGTALAAPKRLTTPPAGAPVARAAEAQ